jgi:diaminopimelate epimerase
MRKAAVHFVKASACGNDFLLINGNTIEGKSIDEETIDGIVIAAKRAAERADFTRRICDRHDGVGADGVEWMYPHSTADLEIQLVNADGSGAEISGNGTRCAAAYFWAEQGKETITIQTGAGLKTCVLTSRNQSEFEFEVDMGEAIVGEEMELATGSGNVRGVPVSLGNPHCVVFVPEFSQNWQADAASMQHSSEFKHGVNIELATLDGIHDVSARFFERGVGETKSSGTGSCAAAVAAMTTGKVQSPVRVHAPGGIQTVRKDGNRIFLRGTARLICDGGFFWTGKFESKE